MITSSNAVILNGSNSYISHSGGSQTPFNGIGSNGFLVSAWIYPRANGNSSAWLVGNVFQNGGNGTKRILFGINNAGRVSLWVTNNGQSSNFSGIVPSTGSVTLNAWNHIAASRANGSGWKTWLNGNEVAAKGDWFPTLDAFSTLPYIGRAQDNSTNVYFNGYIQDVLVYKFGTTDFHSHHIVADIMNRGGDRYLDSNCVFYSPCGEGTGTSVKEYSQSGFSGTFNNPPSPSWVQGAPISGTGAILIN